MVKVRYYNVKTNGKRCNGIVVRVNSGSKIENRISEMTGAHFDVRLDAYSYDDGEENASYVADIGTRGRKRNIRVEINGEADASFWRESKVSNRIFSKEISRRGAYDMRADAYSHKMACGYCDANLG